MEEMVHCTTEYVNVFIDAVVFKDLYAALLTTSPG